MTQMTDTFPAEASTHDMSGPAQHWIGGAWTGSGKVSQSIDPSTGAVIGSFHEATVEEARAAVDAAAEAFVSTPWSRLSDLRARALEGMADALQDRVPQLAAMLAQEGGKLFRETTWEVAGAAQWLRYAAASARMQTTGRAAEVLPGQYFHSQPEPSGVAAIMSPWNSPIILTVRALGPALAAGCTVVVKLPGRTALTNAMFAEAIAAVEELPPGVVNVITETGGDGARHLVASEKVAVVSFTGSTATGRQIAANAAATLKRVGLELGGKTPLVVFPSADLDHVIPTLVQAAVTMNGQFCCTGSRVLAHRDVADRVRTALAEALDKVRLGTWDDDEAELGPLIDRDAVQRIDAIVQEAESYGTVLVRGGPVTDGPLAAPGTFYRPSLVEVADTDLRMVQEEIFGPVQTFEVFDDEADAIRKANATQYGLAASVFTGDPIQARRVAREIRAGGMWINTWGVMSEQFEQVGFKGSGYGPLCGLRAIEEFQDLKTYAEVDPAGGGVATAG